jgi:hypothetical protein
MSFKKLTDFGKLWKNKTRVIVVSLQEYTDEKGTNKYIQFHEHFKNDKGELIPRSVKKEAEREAGGKSVKQSDRVISFSIPFAEESIKELVAVAGNIEKYFGGNHEPVNTEDGPDPF